LSSATSNRKVAPDPTFLPDPSARLTAAFEAAAARMRGLGFVNPALAVEAVAFAPWDGQWLGVMVTPWCMNLMLLPRDARAWHGLAVGDKQRYTFPAGEYEFIGANDVAIGPYQICSLFSPVLEFRDHETARLVASLARDALFDPANADLPTMPIDDLTPAEAAPAGDGPLAQIKQTLEAPLSKRDLLRGRFIGTIHDDRG